MAKCRTAALTPEVQLSPRYVTWRRNMVNNLFLKLIIRKHVFSRGYPRMSTHVEKQVPLCRWDSAGAGGDSLRRAGPGARYGDRRRDGTASFHSGTHTVVNRMTTTSFFRSCLLFSIGVLAANVWARDSRPDHGVIGVEPVHLTPDYWIAKHPRSDALVVDASAIAEQNTRLRSTDPSVNHIAALPATLERTRVRNWIESLSRAPESPLYDDNGVRLSPGILSGLRKSLALDSIATRQATRYGMVTQRADLRTFPTQTRVFNAPGNTDIDRFQENALFPGTPVAIVHESDDGEWWFVVSDLYEAWVAKRDIAVGSADQAFGYARKTPYLVITGNDVRTNFTPEQPQVSELKLDMGIRVPLLADWPPDRPVNGQHHYAAYVIELPIRGKDGSLEFVPALLARSSDVATDYLPLSRETLLRQSFKFLGERYGWGHSYNARDCSGFVSEVYRSFGVTLPRNTKDQATSPALHRIALDAGMGHAERIALLRTLDVGDLVYIPGHVMMVIGFEDGLPYVIHDTTGIGYRDSTGKYKRVLLNGVAVTPLVPLMAGDEQFTIDRITSVQRMRPASTGPGNQETQP